MGFGAFGNQGATLRPTSVGRNRAKPPTIGVAGYETEAANVFGLAHQMFVAGESFPRMAIYPSSLAGGGGAAAPDASFAYGGPPSGAASGAVGAWQHNGVRIADLNWRNVKHWGAVGDGSTDDKAAIQACIDVGAGTVYLPPGTFSIASGLKLSSGVRLVGAGQYRTTIKAAAGMATQNTMVSNNGLASTMFGSTGISKITIEDIEIDGNEANRTGTGGGHLIWFRGGNSVFCDVLNFRRLSLINSPSMALALQNCTRVLAAQNHIKNCTRDGISFWGTCVWCRIEGNLIENCGDDGVAFNSVSDDGTIDIKADMRDNTVTGNTIGPGLAPGGSAIALTGCRRTTVSGNVIWDYATGIRMILFHTTPLSTLEDNVIVANTISNTGQSTSMAAFDGTNGNAIWIHSGNIGYFWNLGANPGGPGAAPISRVVVADNVIWGPRGHGVWVSTATNGGTISDIQIHGNSIEGGGSAPDANSVGILVGGATGSNFGSARSNHFVAAVTTIQDVAVRGNRVARMPYYGIRIHGVLRPTVESNRVVQNGLQTTAPGISLASCTDSLVCGNRSRNLTGSGQTYGVEFVSTAGTAVCNGNMVSGNSNAAGILNTTAGGTFYIWDNPGSTVTRAAPPN